MVNGYLIINKDSYVAKHYGKKIINMIRLLFIWEINADYYAFAKGQFAVKELIWNASNSFFAYEIVPFWFICIFVIIYTILLIAFKTIKGHITAIVFGLRYIYIIIILEM